jgi:hypothetical protein
MSFIPLVVTCMYERPGVSSLFLSNMNRLDVSVLAAVSDDNSAELCFASGASFFYYDNDPLGYKWNTAIEVSLNFAFWTHLVISGDDMVFSREFFDRAAKNESRDYMGITSMYIVDPYTRESLNMRCDFVIGPGRVLSRSLVERIVESDGLFDPGISRGLDYSADRTLSAMSADPFILDGDTTLVTDVKTRKNIWDFAIMKTFCDTCTYNEATSHFFGDEVVIMNHEADLL